MNVSEMLLWAFVLNLGIAFGAGLYETKIILPQWFKKSGSGYVLDTLSMRETDTGRKFWGFVTTMPLTLLTVINLVFAWQTSGNLYNWWLSAGLITLTERLGTFGCFIPTAIKLMKEEDISSKETTTRIRTWILGNYIRMALNFIGWIAALKALTLYN